MTTGSTHASSRTTLNVHLYRFQNNLAEPDPPVLFSVTLLTFAVSSRICEFGRAGQQRWPPTAAHRLPELTNRASMNVVYWPKPSSAKMHHVSA